MWDYTSVCTPVLSRSARGRCHLVPSPCLPSHYDSCLFSQFEFSLRAPGSHGWGLRHPSWGWLLPRVQDVPWRGRLGAGQGPELGWSVGLASGASGPRRTLGCRRTPLSGPELTAEVRQLWGRPGPRTLVTLWFLCSLPPRPRPGVNFSLEQCSPNGTDPYKPKCPESDAVRHEPAFPEWLTVTLLCLYLLFTNILLLNLLIAMFK